MSIQAIDYAIIGGTGLYRIEGLDNIRRMALDTPYGNASDEVVCGDFKHLRLAFLARHGENHDLPPHRINYRANIHAIHQLQPRGVIGINAVGGIRDDMGPRVLAIPDQIIDYTHGRISSYGDAEGAEVRHIDFSEPYTTRLRSILLEAASSTGVAVVDGGCYGATQGPRLETRAEISRMRRDGCDLVGMTGMPEAALARELNLPYACLALVANWAAGCGDAREISIEEIFGHLKAATAEVPKLLAALPDTA